MVSHCSENNQQIIYASRDAAIGAPSLRLGLVAFYYDLRLVAARPLAEGPLV